MKFAWYLLIGIASLAFLFNLLSIAYGSNANTQWLPVNIITLFVAFFGLHRYNKHQKWLQEMRKFRNDIRKY